MDDRLLDKIAEPFNLKLPEYTNMRAMIEEVLPAVERYSEPGLREEAGPLTRISWVRLTDNPGDTVLQLHRFLPGGRLDMANDGILTTTAYEILDDDRLIIGDPVPNPAAKKEKPGKESKSKPPRALKERFLYQLAFMDNDFLILQRHGNDANFTNKYILYVNEPLGVRLTWDEALEKLVAKYRNNAMPWWLVLAVLLGIAAIVLYLS